MKPWSPVLLGLRLNIRFVPVVALLAIIGPPQIGCKSSPVVPGSSISRSPETLRQSATLRSDSSPARLVCPTFGSSPVPESPQSKGGHKVILSWRASAPADSKHAAAVGYCVYRGTKREAPPTELMNSSPFPGTQCMDDFVENGNKYYYVVRAINAKGVTSVTSKPVAAAIPRMPRSNPDASGDSAPLCRLPASVK